MKFLKLVLALSMPLAFAAKNTPDNFSVRGGSDKAVFVDFSEVNYDLKYLFSTSKVEAKTTITFTQDETGMPIFDLIPSVNSATIDGEVVSIKEISSPTRNTKYKLVNKHLAAGVHTLVVTNNFTKNVSFESGGVQSAFWMSDLSDRSYIERYLPTNIEYDQYKTVMNLEFVGASNEQDIFTNGSVVKHSAHKYTLAFPDYFTASSLFFHTTTKGKFPQTKFDFTSINGKIIPVQIYSASTSNVRRAKIRTVKVLKELESKFGAWSHPTVTVYVAGLGGMEYSGATITSMSALGHELTHSYFARGVMPIDGNSGWMDEAIASWRDGGYKSTRKPNFSSTSMAGHTQYTRTTDRKAYTQGANFMAYLNNRLENIGGLRAFLAELYTSYTHKNIDTELFRNKIETYSGINFEADFKKYIYGAELTSNKKSKAIANPFHPVLSAQEQLDLL